MSSGSTPVWGDHGPRAVLVHGSLATGPEAWEGQRPLAERGYRLVVPTRGPYADGAPSTAAEDFADEAADVGELLGDGAHLVGHSSGGIIAMLAAAARPEAVRSLVVVEPPAFTAAADDPAVRALRARTERVFDDAAAGDEDFLREFLDVVGYPADEIPPEVLAGWAALVPALRYGTRPWELDLPLDALAQAPFPVVTVSGGHSPAFTAMCAALAEACGGEHVVVPGGGHEVQTVTGVFADVLLELWRRVDG